MHGASGWDIATAIGTCGAVVVGLGAIIAEQWARRAERNDELASQARLITVGAGGHGISGNVLMVRLTNHSQQPVFGLELDQVTWLHPDGREESNWRIPPTVDGYRASTNVLRAGADFDVPVEFLDSSGDRMRLEVPARYRATFSFHDARGLTWSRTAAQSPQRLIEQHPWWKRR